MRHLTISRCAERMRNNSSRHHPKEGPLSTHCVLNAIFLKIEHVSL